MRHGSVFLEGSAGCQFGQSIQNGNSKSRSCWQSLKRFTNVHDNLFRAAESATEKLVLYRHDCAAYCGIQAESDRAPSLDFSHFFCTHARSSVIPELGSRPDACSNSLLRTAVEESKYQRPIEIFFRVETAPNRHKITQFASLYRFDPFMPPKYGRPLFGSTVVIRLKRNQTIDGTRSGHPKALRVAFVCKPQGPLGPAIPDSLFFNHTVSTFRESVYAPSRSC